MRGERLARKEADDADAPAAEAADTSHIASQVTKLSREVEEEGRMWGKGGGGEGGEDVGKEVGEYQMQKLLQTAHSAVLAGAHSAALALTLMLVCSC